jgi:hypothetical protein
MPGGRVALIMSTVQEEFNQTNCSPSQCLKCSRCAGSLSPIDAGTCTVKRHVMHTISVTIMASAMHSNEGQSGEDEAAEVARLRQNAAILSETSDIFRVFQYHANTCMSCILAYLFAWFQFTRFDLHYRAICGVLCKHASCLRVRVMSTGNRPIRPY